jgi:hypothetical protein
MEQTRYPCRTFQRCNGSGSSFDRIRRIWIGARLWRCTMANAADPGPQSLHQVVSGSGSGFGISGADYARFSEKNLILNICYVKFVLLQNFVIYISAKYFFLYRVHVEFSRNKKINCQRKISWPTSNNIIKFIRKFTKCIYSAKFYIKYSKKNKI